MGTLCGIGRASPFAHIKCSCIIQRRAVSSAPNFDRHHLILTMKLRHLESALEDVSDWEAPKIELEQYQTTPHLAARMVHVMHGYGDVEDRVVMDLGCGCGMLSIASSLMGSAHVIGVDIDVDALATCAENLDHFDLTESVDLIRADVSQLKLKRSADTVLMNPPFGTRVKGIDMVFVKRGLELATTAVYSLHKSSTREHIAKKAREWGVKMTVVAELRFDLPASYSFHRSLSKDIQVDFIRFTLPAPRL